VSDGQASDTAVVSITIGTVTANQPPNAVDDTFQALPSPASLVVGVDRDIFTNDTDPEGTPLTASISTTATANGIISGFDGTAGTFTYTPNPNFTGTDSFVYQITDGGGLTDTATVSINVAVNNPPVVVNDTYSIVAGTTRTVDQQSGVAINDVDASPLTVQSVSTTTQGTLTLNPDGSFVYTPGPGAVAGSVDSFTYIAVDEFGATATSTATVTLSIVSNTPPNAQDDVYDIAINRTLTGSAVNSLIQNDVDPDPGTTLTTSVVSQPTKGTLTLEADGTFVYSPSAGTAATVGEVVTFTYAAIDPAGASDTATVSITVNAAANLDAVDDNYSVALGQTLSVVPTSNPLLANDALGGSSTASITVLTGPTLGQFVTPPGSDGTFVYTATAGATAGVDSFTYQFSFDGQTSDTATAFITLIANQLPIANNDTFTAIGDRPLTVTTVSTAIALGVLANDTDPDGDTLTASIPIENVGTNGPGQIQLNADGSFVYTPPATPPASNTAIFVYRVSDGLAQQTATLTISLAGNTAPTVPPPAAYSVNRGNVLSVSAATAGVLGAATDPDNDLLTATTLTSTTRGSLTLNPDGTFVYTPDAAQFPTAGTDSFVYQVTDGGGNTVTQVATLSVAVTSAPPVADNDTFTVNANNSLSVTAAEGVLNGDTDPDGDSLLVAGSGTATITTTSNGVVVLNPDGAFTYQPASNFVGTDTFTYQATDGISPSGTATVTLSVGATNNPPTLQVPGVQITSGTNPVGIPGVTVADVDAGTNPIRLRVSAPFQIIDSSGIPQPLGTLNIPANPAGITFVTGANGTGSFTLEGTVAAINAALEGLTFTPVSNLPDTIDTLVISIQANDRGFTGGQATVSQTANATVTVNRVSDEQIIADINQIPNATSGTESSSPQSLVAAGSVLYFSANDGDTGRELWRSDGTTTTRVADLNTVADGANSNPANLTVVGNRLYFTANDGVTGIELWSLDLTQPAVQPVRISDINPGIGNSSPSNLIALSDGTLYFRATNSQGGVGIYRTDGTTVTPISGSYSSPVQLTVVGNTVYFVANGGTELWRTDGTTQGTVEVREVVQGSIDSLLAVGNTLYFVATDATNGRELWRSDGTPVGTVRFSDINPGAASSNPTNLVNLNGVVYFFATGSGGVGLYRTTASGVEQVPGSALPATGAAPRDLTVVANRLFFVVDLGGATGQQLWTATPTAGVTGLVRDINPAGSDNIQSLTNLNGKLFFVATDASATTRIWQSDGTANGTTQVTTGTFTSAPSNLTAAGGTIFFTASGLSSAGTEVGNELWGFR